jgi:hypothetical protein
MGSTLISSAALETGGGGNIVAKVLSTEDGHDEVEDVLRRAKAEVRDLLERNQCVVEGLRDALLERDELVGAEILEVIASVGPALEAQI